MDMLVLEEEKRLGVQSPALQKVKVSVEESVRCSGDRSPRPSTRCHPTASSALVSSCIILYHPTPCPGVEVMGHLHTGPRARAQDILGPAAGDH